MSLRVRPMCSFPRRNKPFNRGESQREPRVRCFIRQNKGHFVQFARLKAPFLARARATGERTWKPAERKRERAKATSGIKRADNR